MLMENNQSGARRRTGKTVKDKSGKFLFLKMTRTDRDTFLNDSAAGF